MLISREKKAKGMNQDMVTPQKVARRKRHSSVRGP